jgi:hypothetical protein
LGGSPVVIVGDPGSSAVVIPAAASLRSQASAPAFVAGSLFIIPDRAQTKTLAVYLRALGGGYRELIEEEEALYTTDRLVVSNQKYPVAACLPDVGVEGVPVNVAIEIRAYEAGIIRLLDHQRRRVAVITSTNVQFVVNNLVSLEWEFVVLPTGLLARSAVDHPYAITH